MAARILLIRAVNVGGATLPMAELRALASALGATDVSTYIASGNLICASPDDPADFDRALERAIEERYGFFREVISRSPSELADALAAHPFEVINPKFSYIHALCARPEPPRIAALEGLDFGADRVRVIGSEAHLRYGEGAGSSKLTNATLARHLGVQGTARNLLTVRRLVELAS